MAAYILRRLLLVIPTLFFIFLLNFAVIHVAPGGPVEQYLAELEGFAVESGARFGGGAGGETVSSGSGGAASSGNGEGSAGSTYRGASGLDPEFIARIEAQFGFDRPPHERFFKLLADYAVFDFGNSFFRDRPVIDIVLDKMPVSITLGAWTTLITYIVCIPLGIAKAVRDGSRFDVWTSGLVIVGNAIPSFLFAVLLVVLFAGGQYLDWFPLRGLTSENFEELSPMGKVADYLWHIVLPVASMVVGGFATLTMLTKNSFLDQIRQQYVTTALAKGLPRKRVLYGHIFRNAMLIVIAGFPAAFLSILFTGALLIEFVFSLDGLGRLGWEAVVKRDYPIMFGTLYFFGLIGLLLKIVSDITYTLVDPRIDFEARDR